MAFRRIKGRWCIDVCFEGVRYRKVSPDNTSTSAREYELDFRAELKRKNSKDQPRCPYDSYASYAEYWMDKYVSTQNSASEIEKKRGILKNHLIPFFGEMKLEDINEREVDEFKALKKEEGSSPKTINNILGVLGISLTSAVRWKYITAVPQLKLFRVPKVQIETISNQSELLLLNDTSDPVLNTMIVIALQTGMRVGEILALRWMDVDLERRDIVVNASMNIIYERASTKNKKVRTIPIREVLFYKLYLFQASATSRECVYLFDRGDGEPISMHAAKRGLKAVVRRLGITENVGWHKMRHTFATNFANSGQSLRTLQEILGHSSLEMTERYSHVGADAKREAMSSLDGSYLVPQGIFKAEISTPIHLVNKTELEKSSVKSKNDREQKSDLVHAKGFEPF